MGLDSFGINRATSTANRAVNSAPQSTQIPGTSVTPQAMGSAANINNYEAILRAQYNPQFASNALNANVDYNMIAARSAYTAQQPQWAQSQYANQLQSLGHQRASNLYDQQAITGNRPLYDQIRAQYANQAGLNDQELAATQGFANRGYDITSEFTAKGLQNFLAQNALATKQQGQAASSAGISGGFGLAPGVQEGKNQILASGQLKAGDAMISAAQRLADALLSKDEKISSSQFSHDNRAFNLTIQGIRQDIASNLDDLQLKKLQETAKSYGTDANSLYDSLQQSLAKTGMDQYTNLADLIKLGSSSEASQQALYQQMIKELYQYSNSDQVSNADRDAYNQQVTAERQRQEIIAMDRERANRSTG